MQFENGHKNGNIISVCSSMLGLRADVQGNA